MCTMRGKSEGGRRRLKYFSCTGSPPLGGGYIHTYITLHYIALHYITLHCIHTYTHIFLIWYKYLLYIYIEWDLITYDLWVYKSAICYPLRGPRGNGNCLKFASPRVLSAALLQTAVDQAGGHVLEAVPSASVEPSWNDAGEGKKGGES